MTAPGATTLAGYTLANTDLGHRCVADQLRQHGAAVVDLPMLRVVPGHLDARMRTATRRLLRDSVDHVVATSATGWTRWMSAAAAWGLSDALGARLEAANILSMNAEINAALRDTGFTYPWTSSSSELAEAVSWVLTQEAAHRRVALTADEPLPAWVIGRLRARHVDVIVVPTRRWALPRGLAPVHKLAQMVIQREVHAVTFTTSTAAKALVDVAARTGREKLLLCALATDVAVAAVDADAATPFLERDIPVWSVNDGDAEALARQLTDVLVARRREFRARGQRIAVQGNAVLVNGMTIRLGPRPATVLRLLADHPGQTLSRVAIEQIVPLSTRASRLGIDHAVWRLRTELGEYGWLVATVSRRGYRLAVD